MADFNIVMPKLGESVQEATIIRWMVKPGDMVQEDDALLEIATDKVDSEIPSPVAGKVLKLLFAENALVPVGDIIAVINTEGKGEVIESSAFAKAPADDAQASAKAAEGTVQSSAKATAGEAQPLQLDQPSSRFYSPLVMSIARKESIDSNELEDIAGTGTSGRVRKQDILKYLENRAKQPRKPEQVSKQPAPPRASVNLQPGDQIVEMDRMRKLIAEHMVMSKQISPHVTNFVEADVTNLVLWRDRIKDDFQKREKIKLTFMPAFVEVTAKALKEFPGINASVDGDKIILRKNVNVGIAVALPSGNLIVPVVKNADQKSMVGLAIDLNHLAEAARTNKLSPDDIQGGTFTISNFGTFRNLTGTPIINQPQVAILATGNIEKKPAVIETPAGDAIAIRHKIILSLTYDHRVVDGALGGSFLRRLADLLEAFDVKREI
jgi:2-oxoglutarate dehydrogenase E2 component (dihydrolipoamide succinyltransferase)